MPARVVVVGAGVIGAAVALRLAEGGAAVTLVEAVVPGAGTSGGSFAWLNSNEKTPRHYYELNMRGMRAHRELAERSPSASWYHPVGNLEWVRDQDEAAHLRARVERLRDWGYSVQVLGRHQVAEIEPGLVLPPDVTEFAYFPDEGYVDGLPLVRMLTQRATAAGCVRYDGDPVRELLVRSERAAGVVLRSGRRVDADAVVVCAGWRTAELAAEAGVRVPLVPVHPVGSRAVCVLVTAAVRPDSPVRPVVHTPDLILRPLGRDGLLLESPRIPHGLAYDASPPAGHVEELLRLAQATVRLDDEPRVVDARLCVRPLPVDGYPIVGWCPELPGCYLAVTHSGITLAPYLSVLIAGEILAGEPALALAPYRLDRFSARGDASTPSGTG